MAYRAVDSDFNRANYPKEIGKTFETPPSYIQVVEVKSTGECGEVAAGVFRVYAVSEALTKGWDRLDPDMIDETLDGLKKRVDDLVKNKKVTVEASKNVLEVIQTLKQVNEGNAQISLSPQDKLMPKIIHMAVSSIGECVCGTQTEIIQNKPPSRDQVMVTLWEERDRIVIAIVDKESQNTYAQWVDDHAREMFEDGFFKPGRHLEDSVLDYAVEMGILSK